MIIRTVIPSDIPFLCELHNASVRQECTADYSEAQISDWISAIKPQGYIKAMELHEFMVAVDEQIVGFCIFNTGKAEVTALYISPRSIRKGIGHALMNETEVVAHEYGIRELHLKSTLNAVPFYERMGFVRLGYSSYLLACGTELPYVEMGKILLDPQGGAGALNP